MVRKLNEQKFCGWCGNKVVYKSEWVSECLGCGYNNYTNPKPCCSIIIADGDKILMLERAINPHKGKFDFPGGFMDMTDTSIEEAAHRELAEELGITKNMVASLRYLGSDIQPYAWQDSELLTAPSFFVCTIPQEKLNLISVDQKENSELRWVQQQDMADIEFAFGADKRMAAKYFEELHGERT